MTTDTEARLRSALRAGAELITLDPAALPEPTPGRRKLWVLWALAAAAVVVAVATLTVATRHSPSSAPRHPSSAPPTHHSSTASVPPPTTAELHPADCRASNEGSWNTTLRAGSVPITGGMHTPEPLAGVDDRGELVILDAERIAVLGPARRQQRTIYLAPHGSRLDAGELGAGLPQPVFDGNSVAFATEPTRPGPDRLSHIGVVNIRSGAVRMIYNRVGSSIVRRPILVDGVVYWTVSDVSGSGFVYSYTIATGERRTLDTGSVSGPFTIGGGVYWDKNQSVVTHIAGVLPPGYVVQANPSSNAVFAADATRLAWVRGHEILMRQDGGPSVSVYRSQAGPTPHVVALVGPYLVWQNNVRHFLRSIVLDLRTGATAPLFPVEPAAMPAATPTGRYLVLGLRDGLFSPPAVVDTTRAPRLHC